PVYGEQQRPRIAQEFALGPLVDLPDEFHTRLIEQRHDFFAEIDFVDLVDLGGDLERDFERSRNPDGPVGPLLRRDASEKRHIVAARPVRRLEQLGRDAVIDRADEVRIRDRLSLPGWEPHPPPLAATHLWPP